MRIHDHEEGDRASSFEATHTRNPSVSKSFRGWFTPCEYHENGNDVGV